MQPSSRTPEGDDNTCSVCGHEVRIEHSQPSGDATCPHCGALIWLTDPSPIGGISESLAAIHAACRLRNAEVAMGRGNWQRAERELLKAAYLDPDNLGIREKLEGVRQELQSLHPRRRKPRKLSP